MLISHPDYKKNKIYVFKKTFIGASEGEANINVYSPTLYKLYIDDTLIFCGPQEASRNKRYYDSVCLTEYLKNGENEILIEVLAEDKMHLDIWGDYCHNNEKISLSSDSSWQVSVKSGSKLTAGEFGLSEEYTPSSLIWKNAEEIGESEKDSLCKRTISPLNIKMRCLNLIQDGGNTYDASETTTGFIRLNFSGNGTIKLIYKKSFISHKDDDKEELYDVIHCENTGTWEGFSKRFFRFINVETTGNANVDYIYYYESTYPLNESVTYDFSNEKDNKLYKLALRTLKCCSQDFYYDAPYYMEKSSAKSVFLNSIYTFYVSHDVKLVKNALYKYDFSDNSFENSLYYTLLLCEYYKKYGDEELVYNKIDKIINFYNDAINGLYDNINELNYVIKESEILFKLTEKDYSPYFKFAEKNYENFDFIKLMENTDAGEDYFLLRALENDGRYNERNRVLEKYYAILDEYTSIPEFLDRKNHCCSANSVVLYEFNAKDLGVTWENNTFCREIHITPWVFGRKEAKGKVTTPFGDVFVEWKNGNKFFIELYMPENVRKIITFPDGTTTETTESYYITE